MKKNKNKFVDRKETRNKLMIAAAGVCLLAGVYGASITMASENKGNREGVIEMLASKFNLDESEIETAMEDFRAEHQAERQEEMKSRLEKRLSEAVEEGKITSDQKDLILAKREEMQTRISQESSGDREERRTQMESYRSEMRQWAEDNGIEVSLIGFNHRGRMGGGMRHGFDQNNE